MHAISDRLHSGQSRVCLYVRPGAYLVQGQTIGHASGLNADACRSICQNLTIAAIRRFEEDASYGLLVLSEIASRALSPGINDAGTAIAVPCRQEKLLLDWSHATHDETAPRFARLFLPDTSRAAMIDTAFASVARDGAGQIEVALRLQEVLARLAKTPDADLAQAAREMSQHACEYAEAALPLERDKTRLRAAVLSPSP